MKEKLTPTQEKIYAYIAGYIDDYGFSPTYQEIAIRTDMTTQAVESHVKNLVKKGWVRFDSAKKFRKIELIPKGNE
jgi:predicted transcriptional regulator